MYAWLVILELFETDLDLFISRVTQRTTVYVYLGGELPRGWYGIYRRGKERMCVLEQLAICVPRLNGIKRKMPQLAR